MYIYFNKLVYAQFMPKNISKCHVANKEKSFHFVNIIKKSLQKIAHQTPQIL
jgi:hypothetical protein